jgi:hypothetical protein
VDDKKRRPTEESFLKKTPNREPLKSVRHRPHRQRKGVRCNGQRSQGPTHTVTKPRIRPDASSTSDCFTQSTRTSCYVPVTVSTLVANLLTIRVCLRAIDLTRLSESEVPHHSADNNCQRNSNTWSNENDSLATTSLRPNPCGNNK